MDVKEAVPGTPSSSSAPGNAKLQLGQDDVPPGYKRTEVGVIPEDWGVCGLTEIADVRSGLTYQPDDVGSYGTLVLRSSNIQRGYLSLADNVFVTCAVTDSVLVQANDILVCVRNGSRELIGKCAIIPSLSQQAACGAFMAVLRSTEHLFVFHQFRSVVVQRQIREQLGATINQITAAGFRSFIVPYPAARQERIAIATALSDADALIAALQRLIAKKRAIKQGTMQALLTGRQRLPGFTGEWLKVPFGEVATPRKDRVDPRITGPYDFCVELEHLQSGTGTRKGHTVAAVGSSLKTVFYPGDVLFGKLRAYLRKYWRADQQGVCSTEIWSLATKGCLKSSQLLFQIVQTTDFLEAASLAYGTHMPRSDWKTVREHEITIPNDPDEQIAIATALADMDAEIEALEARLAKTRALKAGMMQQLLTGRIRLPLEEAA